MKPQRSSERFRAYRQVARALSAAYPRAFPRKGPRPPLAVGLASELLGVLPEGVSRSRARLFLSMWTSSSAYLVSVSMRRPRVGLDGARRGEVDAAHAAEAAGRVAARRERAAARALDRAAAAS